MDDDTPGQSHASLLIEKLRPFISDDERYGRMSADLHDIVEASEWLLSETSKLGENSLTPDSLESFFIDLEVNFIEHVTYHFLTLRGDVEFMLQELGGSELDS